MFQLTSAEDVKLDNVFVNLQEGDNRFSEVQLGDLGGCYSTQSKWATSGTFVGTPMWTSPEIIMEMPWNTATDIWSFGALVRRMLTLVDSLLHTVIDATLLQLISLIYGGDYNLFRPPMERDHEEYILGVLVEQFTFFGPFAPTISEIVTAESGPTIIWLTKEIPPQKLTPFAWITEREIVKRDKDFIGKFMKLDWRDRPTAKDLLEDKWWDEEEVVAA